MMGLLVKLKCDMDMTPAPDFGYRNMLYSLERWTWTSLGQFA
jgi:hypothetical protein